MAAELHPCRYCGDPTFNTVGGTLTPEQVAENEAWERSFRQLGLHTGHCPHLVLPPQPVCVTCAPVVEVMES